MNKYVNFCLGRLSGCQIFGLMKQYNSKKAVPNEI